MAQLAPRFSAERAVRDYTEKHYLPAAVAYRGRSAGKGQAARQAMDWRHSLEQSWGKVSFGELRIESDTSNHTFEVEVHLNDLNPDMVRVELYANPSNGDLVRQEMSRVRPLVGATGGFAYRTAVSATRPDTDYTPRLVPHFNGVAVPLEAAQILWQR